MKASYEDILKRIKDPIQWFDDRGTPRYDLFYPTLVPDIYANEALLLKIRCAGCEKAFLVGLSRSSFYSGSRFRDNLQCVGYGDAPIHGCSGDTMLSDAIRVVEYWAKDEATGHEWQRFPELEITIPQEESEIYQG